MSNTAATISAPCHTNAAHRLAEEMGATAEHPDYPVMDWQSAVAQLDTRLGYWDWVVAEMRFDQHAWIDEV